MHERDPQLKPGDYELQTGHEDHDASPKPVEARLNFLISTISRRCISMTAGV
jgi:hypothetical protein